MTLRSSRSHIVLLLALTAALAAIFGGTDTARAAGCPTTSKATVTGLSASPNNTSNVVAAPHTVSAGVTTDAPDGSGVCVRFSQTSGPSTGWPRYAVTNTQGAASVTWTSSLAGTDIIRIEALDSSGSMVHNGSVSHSWTSKATPSPTPTRTATPRPTSSTSRTPSPSPSRTVTPSPTPSATPSRTPTPTPTPSPTPSATPSPVRSTAPDTTAGFGSGTVVLSHPYALPGGSTVVSGGSCPAGAPVTFSVDGQDAGAATATSTGTFTGAAQFPDLAIGQYALQVTCGGRSETVPIDLVVSSSSQPTSGRGAAVAAVALLLGAAALGGRKDRRP